MSAKLLVELFTEELPPKALRRLGDAFADGIAGSLAAHGLLAQDSPKIVYATPRRLAVKIAAVLERAPDRTETKKLMPAKVAFDADGKPSAALLKRLEKEGSGVAQIERRVDGDAEYVFLNRTIVGITLVEGLQLALNEALANLPIPKSMSYQLADGATTVQFVRPAHGLIALHGDRVVDVSVLGLKAGRVTHGHRFQGVKDIPVATADAYEEALAAHGRVIASFDERRAEIARQLADKAAALGASLGPEADYLPLLDEVTALVEYPTVYLGEFESEFLAVPQECLILTMRQNQKYFPLFDTAGKLTNRFLIVSNMQLADPKTVVEGNQRVVRPRLADARFFFETDRKTKLADRVTQLGAVVYHNKLGSQLERVTRVRELARSIAQKIGADPAAADRAALLAKADLVTHMVGEFPELQGVMGRYYALHDGEPMAVADAIEQHYHPRFSGDSLPSAPIGQCVALADKLDTLIGIFSIGLLPSGDKDPFALRRNALGTLRILIEGNLGASLEELIRYAERPFKGLDGKSYIALIEFIFERLANMLREQGYTAQEIDAVASPILLQHLGRRQNLPPLRELPRRLAAVRAFSDLPESTSLAAANKRVANILKQAEAKGEAFAKTDAGLLKEPAERTLFDALRKTSGQANLLFRQGDYTGYLKTFSVLKSPVDAFFDSVMVMVNDAALRQNRLALLADLRREMNQVADISKLAA